MIGQQLGSFRIDAKIGAGAMGVVYRATHLKTGRPAAVKLITSEGASRGNATERFEREAEILQQFKHPNIVRFLAVGRSRGTSYFAMEFVEGQTLDDLLERQEFLPWREVVDLAIQLCDALQYAHERGIVHRDLKPSNIMITPEGSVKLTDFGIAKDLDATALTATGRTLGTAAYMAPEQIRGTPEVSHKTDLYALGCLLFQMLTGQTPFKGGAIAVLMNCHLNEPAPRPSTKNPEVPRALDDLVLKLMAKGPADRPWDAQAVLVTLTELKEKLARGETIRMVFGPSGAGAALPSQAPAAEPASATPEPAPAATSATSAGTRAGKRPQKRRKKENGWHGSLVGTLGLAAGLLVGVGVLAWLLWPASAEALFAQARPLMASTRYEDWDAAERRYLAELDRRFPGHPYADEVRAFRDKVALYETERRAKVLENALARNPRNDVEGLYLRVLKTSEEAVDAGAEDFAAERWDEAAGSIRSSFPEERGWMLLAEKKAAALREVMARRTAEVRALLDEAAGAEQKGLGKVAANLRRRVVEEYGRYPYLQPLVDSARPADGDGGKPGEAEEAPENSAGVRDPGGAAG
jgi:serine/threonine-protein kinase